MGFGLRFGYSTHVTNFLLLLSFFFFSLISFSSYYYFGHVDDDTNMVGMEVSFVGSTMFFFFSS